MLAILAGVLGWGPPSSAELPGSEFDAGDANLTITDPGGDNDVLDWFNAPGLAKGIEEHTGALDDSFGQGTKEDTPVPTIVDGSIPPNKSDLTRFYVASNQNGTTGDTYLYLAWERVQEPSGTTNMDFELNQSTVMSGNGVTPVRTANDVLIKYDLSQGGTNPSIGFHKWVTTGSKSQCDSANSVPCWGTLQSITAGAGFEASINSVVVTDPIAPDAPRDLSVRTFGEAAVNLTVAGILPSGGSCAGFASAYLKSRSSDSFTAAIKDFVAPEPITINSCGSVEISKTFSAGTTPATPAVFAVRKDVAPIGGSIGAGDDLFTYPESSTLSAGINATATSMSVADGTKYPATGSFYVLVESEIIKISSRSVNTLTIGQRSVGTPAAAAHPSGATVKRLAACDISTSGGTCTISDLPFGTYWAEEIEVPLGYTGGNPQTFSLSAGDNTAGPLSFANLANPLDVTVVKQDDAANAIAICDATATPPVGQPCADFELYKDGGTAGTTTVATPAWTAGATSVHVADGSVFGSGALAPPVKAIVGSEIVDITNVNTATTPDTLTVARGVLNTVAAGHAVGDAVTKLTFDKACDPSGNVGECIFASVQPGASYWIVESVAPTGYGRDPDLPVKITVDLGDDPADHTYTLDNPRLFKVITFVCGEFDNQLYPSGIVYDSETIGSGKTPDALVNGTTETALCQSSGDHVHGGVATGDHTSKVNIGVSPLP